MRKRLWELDSRLHCPVVGTCLTLEEMRRLARKAGVSSTAASDYERHHALVRAIEGPTVAARIVNKHLNRRHERALARFAQARDGQALTAPWRDALAEGDVAGAFWAVVTHPCTDASFLQGVYGEVPMLSHLSEHTHHAERRELHALTRRAQENGRSAPAHRLS